MPRPGRRDRHRPGRPLSRITAGRPFPGQVFLADVGRPFHRRIIDRLEGPTAVARDMNGGVDPKIFALEIACIWRDARAAEILPCAHAPGKRMPKQRMSSGFLFFSESAAVTSWFNCADLARIGERSSR